MGDWKATAPPNEVWVEVKDGKEVRVVRALWGRDGRLPHWEDPNGGVYGHKTFRLWRTIGVSDG